MIEHVATGRRYIGKSVDVERRIAVHFAPGQTAVRRSHLYRAIAKYGRDAFRVVVLEHCSDDEEARERESVWIHALETKTPNGFNMTDGGEGSAGIVMSAETRAKMGASQRLKTVSTETKAKISAANKGKTRSAETRAKLSIARRARQYAAEAIENMTIAQRNRRRAEKEVSNG